MFILTAKPLGPPAPGKCSGAVPATGLKGKCFPPYYSGIGLFANLTTADFNMDIFEAQERAKNATVAMRFVFSSRCGRHATDNDLFGENDAGECIPSYNGGIGLTANLTMADSKMEIMRPKRGFKIPP